MAHKKKPREAFLGAARGLYDVRFYKPDRQTSPLKPKKPKKMNAVEFDWLSSIMVCTALTV
jgi:hypothetical protein